MFGAQPVELPISFVTAGTVEASVVEFVAITPVEKGGHSLTSSLRSQMESGCLDQQNCGWQQLMMEELCAPMLGHVDPPALRPQTLMLWVVAHVLFAQVRVPFAQGQAASAQGRTVLSTFLRRVAKGRVSSGVVTPQR